MGQFQVTVVDLLRSRFHQPGGFENLGRAGGFGTRFPVSIFGGNPIVGGHPLTRTFVCDDLRPRFGENFVVARLIDVIVGVEECMHLCGGGESLRSAAVHQHEAVIGGERNNISAPRIQHRDVVRETGLREYLARVPQAKRRCRAAPQ